MRTLLAGLRHTLVLAAALALVASHSIEASANPLTCVASPHISENNGLDRKDVTFGGNAADDCWGVGDADGSEGTNPWHSGAWALLASDSPNDNTSVVGNANGVQFSLLAQSDGVWGLIWTDLGTHLPLTMDLVVVVATSSGYASYWFDDEVFGKSPDNRSGTFTIAFGNSDSRALDHFAVYRPLDVKLEARIAPQAVPEPAALTLMGAGLIGLAVSRRRSRKSI